MHERSIAHRRHGQTPSIRVLDLNKSIRLHRILLLLLLLFSSRTLNVESSLFNPDATPPPESNAQVQHDIPHPSPPTSVPVTPAPLQHGKVIRTLLAGKIAPFLSHFLITRQKAQKMWSALLKIAEPTDIFFIALLGWATVPAIKFPYDKLITSTTRTATTSDTAAKPPPHPKKEFRDTKLFFIADLISQASKIAAILYIIDCLVVILTSIGIPLPKNSSISHFSAKIFYTLWAATRLQTFKRYLICRTLQITHYTDLGKATVYDRLLDLVLLASVTLFVLDLLSVQMGMALSSIFALSGVGTLVFSLASKDLAAQLVNGVSLTASDKFREGDEIKMGDGTSGVVQKLDWMDTLIRGSDELMVKIPNSYIAKQRIYNYSRIKKCQVVQTFRFKYSDAPILKSLMDDIKREIKKSCPLLITDGSRAFRLTLRDFKEEWIEAVLDCHFNIKPTGDVYWNNRQKALEAVLRAMERKGVEFAVPS